MDIAGLFTPLIEAYSRLHFLGLHNTIHTNHIISKLGLSCYHGLHDLSSRGSRGKLFGGAS
jgi:hypothetical protein